MKDFDRWNTKKICLDGRAMYKHPKEGEVWWCSVGINVGTEIYGKGDEYARPVIVVNADLGQSFIGIPLTSKIKNRDYSCVVRLKEGKLNTALVSQVRNFDKRRLIKKIGRLLKEDCERVRSQFLALYKIL